MLPILLYSARVFLYPLVLLKHLQVSIQQHPLFELKLPLRLLSKQPLFLTLLSDVHGSRFATIFDVRFDPPGLFFPFNPFIFVSFQSPLSSFPSALWPVSTVRSDPPFVGWTYF